ncbi:MAG: beta-N-acetylhexosaminidase [Eubacteriales bacterium]|nr:beta-N-acetylhexosaminidase [Eubacteriales bacterium]
MDTKIAIGQKLVVGFDGAALSEDFIQLVRRYKVGNVILFKDNLRSVEQTQRLCMEIQRLITEETGFPAFITVDEEGGLVSRIPHGAIHAPGNMAVAATGEPANAYACARIVARQLKGLGINFNLAPSLDVNSNPSNPVIGVRSWGDEPEKVSAFAEAAIRGYADEQLLCCGKHFPGHGDTAVDSHIGLPCVDRTEQQLQAVELKPFLRAIRTGVPAVMSSHILFPAIEKERLPATMSRRMMTGLLREQLGFDGLILSDCMAMDAIRKFYGTAQGALAAVRAGIDLIFVCHQPELQTQTVKLLVEAADQGAIDETELNASIRRILRFKKKYAFSSYDGSLTGRAEDLQKAWEITRHAITHVSGPLFIADQETFFCGCPEYRGSLVGNGAGAEASCAQLLGNRFCAPYFTTSQDPDDAEIKKALTAAAGYSKAVMITLNGHLMGGQLKLGKALAENGRKLIVAAMRNPYDLAAFSDAVGKLAAFDCTPASVEALEAVLRGGPCMGRLPVKW